MKPVDNGGSDRPAVTPSLRLRLGVALLLVSLLFLGLVAMVLDRGFREAARQAVQEALQARVYTLLAVMEVGEEGTPLMPAALPESRLSTPASGLYARIIDASGRAVWRSGSVLGNGLPAPLTVAPGRALFGHESIEDGPALFRLSFGVEWEADDGRLWRYTIEIAESDLGYQASVGGFRDRLWTGLGAVAVALLVAQLLLLAWGLRPLQRVGNELAAVQSGERGQLGDGYPRELAQLTDRINRFIDQQQASRDRYRNSLDDLAHSLKTPLAVLGTAVDRNQVDSAADQVGRMREIIDYQLGRAATVGASPLTVAVPVARVATSVQASLDKVHAGRSVDCSIEVDPGVAFTGDRGDLLEVLGNLMDNAYKWAGRRVIVGAAVTAGSGERRLTLRVDDDGRGIRQEQAAGLLDRGQRGDPGEVAGHGIGLAVVREIAVAYGGRVELSTSKLGGLCASVELPGAELAGGGDGRG